MTETLKIDYLLNSRGDYLKKGEPLDVSSNPAHVEKRFGHVPVIVKRSYNEAGELLQHNPYIVWIDENFMA